MAAPKLEFFWEIGSTNSYFAWHLLRPLAGAYDAVVVPRGLNLGHIFRHYNYSLAAEPAAKIAWRKRDLERWAEIYGLPFRFPDVFPIKTSRAMRGAIVMRAQGLEADYMDLLFARYWEQNDASIADYAGLRTVVAELGCDPDAFEAAAESAEVRALHTAENDDAIARGVFGAPGIIVGGELFWGKDRMEHVETVLKQQAGESVAAGD